MKSSIRATLLFMAAALMGFAAVVNAVVSVPHLQEDMTEIHVRPRLHQALSLGLHFGTFAMFGFALVVLAAAVRAMRGEATARLPLAIIAAVYFAFGVMAFVAFGASPHVLGYAFAGLLVGAAATLPPRP